MGRKHLTRILALVLALTMLSTAAVAAASFPDLEGHWAEEYMMELYEMDYLKGYNDNTMRPDASITGATALTMLSRLFEVDDEAREMAREEYGAYAEEVVPAAQSWLNDEDVIAICLAGGVVPADELEALIDAGGLEGSLTREYLSVLFVRAMGLEEKAQDIETVELSFTDTESITASRRPYVQVLYETGVIEGNADNTFSPKSSVTRAAVSAMFSRAVDYMKDHGGLPTLEQYDGVEKFKGVIQDVTTTTVTLRDLRGVEYVLDLGKELEVTADGKSVSALSSSYEDKYAELYFDTEDQTVSRAVVDTKSTWIQGILKTSDTSSLSIVNSNDNSTKSYLFDTDDTEFYYEGKSIPKSSLSRGSYVSVKMGEKRLEEVQAFPSEYTIEGEMEEIIYGTTCTLTAIDENGARFQVSFPISETPEISRGGITYTDGLTRLQKGDWLEIEIRSDEVKAIATDTDAKTEKAEGTVASISQTGDGYYLTIEDDGETTRYQVSPYVTVTEDKKTAALSDLQVGDSVTLSLTGNVITDIVIEEAATNTDSFTGKVLLVDTTARQLLVQDESLIYVNTKGATIVSSTGGSITLSSVKEGNTVMIYGSWVSNTELDATLITVVG
jgi:hypothetical protein